MRRVKSPAPPECIDCKKPFRHPSESLEDFPGTVIHASKGRCRTDHKRFRSAADTFTPAPPVEIDEVKAGLEAFLARRRQRIRA